MEINKRIEEVKTRLKEIEGYEGNLKRSLTRLERTLFAELTKNILGKLSLEDRNVKYNFTNLNLIDSISKVVDVIQEKGISQVSKNYIRDINKIFNSVDKQYRPFTTASTIKALKVKQNRAIGKALGVVEDKITTGGFLEEVFDLTPVAADLKRELFRASVGEIDIDVLKRNIKDIVVSGDKLGVLNKKVFNQLNDSFAQVDRAKQKFYSQDLKLQAFIYFGSEIKATRDFCSRRIGKTFLADEFEKDARAAGNFQGRPRNYNPLVDLGGYNCRHSLLYITNREALRRRKDLELVNGKLQVK